MVSPIMQPTLGGLPPLLIMVGGGEVLRDEQIYLAHKCANPSKYTPPGLDEVGLAQVDKYEPTDVQLQVWDDLCHVAPTLSFTRPAKYMYRVVAQFGAWALARAQHLEIEILDDDDISVISSSASDSDKPVEGEGSEDAPQQVGKAGMPLPPFKKHMIRQRITRHGVVHDLVPESELPGCTIKQEEVGVVRPTPVQRWLKTKETFDKKFSSTKAKVHKSIIKDMAAGFVDFGDGEKPPPTALAGRRKATDELVDRKRHKSLGLALWSLWGSKHDEMTMEREKKADSEAKTSTEGSGEGARSFRDVEQRDRAPIERRGSRRRVVVDELQTSKATDSRVPDSQTTEVEETPVAALIEKRREQEKQNEHLSADYVPGTGAAGKRPFLDGIALPFSLGKKDAETASMVTLMSGGDSRPISPMPPIDHDHDTREVHDSQVTEVAPEPRPGDDNGRPQLDNFVTAAEDLPLAKNKGKGKEMGDGNVEQIA